MEQLLFGKKDYVMNEQVVSTLVGLLLESFVPATPIQRGLH
jgi:hypothetical protein